MPRPHYLILATCLLGGILLLMCSFAPNESVQVAVKDPVKSSASFFSPVLVELFTSQGCSSCPPADEVLQKLDDPSIITLSYHVDYWNRLGWRDPYSQASFSERQRNYAQYLNDRGVYTPQAVVNGRSGHIGSRERELRSAITAANGKASPLSIQGSATWEDTRAVNISYRFSDTPTNAVLQVAIVQDNVENKVARGENRGRYLAHSNVVRSLTPIELTTIDGEVRIALAEDLQDLTDHLHLVLFVQRIDDMQVLGATQIVPG